MTTRKRTTRSLAIKSAELATAVPQVVAHRLTRMAIAGPVLSARDRKEFHRMGAEKASAFAASWQAMFLHAMRPNPSLMTAMWRNMLAPPAKQASAMIAAAAAMQGAALAIGLEGLAPVHRSATANARRLRRTKLR